MVLPCDRAEAYRDLHIGDFPLEGGCMRRTLKCTKNVVVALVLLLAGAAVAQTPGEFPQGANVPKNMKQYFLCLLEKGEKHKPMQFADPEMQEHLAYIREQVEAGKYVVVGPALDAGRIGGMAIINAASAEEAKKIVNGDKVVQSGE